MINWIGIIQETLMITSFVIIMMLLIEFINVVSHGKIVKLLDKRPFFQILGGTILGLIPGCMGTFAVVSLYSQRIVSFGALVATMIATSGDEAFFMLTLIPKQAIILFAILGILAIITGLAVDKIFKNKTFIKIDSKPILDKHDHGCSETNGRMLSFKNFSFSKYRIYLLVIISGVIVLASTGWIGHSHSEELLFSLPTKNINSGTEISEIDKTSQHSHNHEGHIHDDCDHDHHDEHECTHNHDHECSHNEDGHIHNHDGEVDIIKIIIITCSILLLIIIILSSDHFIKEHLWEHVIKTHLLKIFLWILGTMIVINLILNITNFDNWIYNNLFIILLIAVLVGIIPQSGPHLVFLMLFIQGSIPFSILLANSIVQDGHGALPLLAESKKSFVIMKLISLILGLVVGSIGLLLGF